MSAARSPDTEEVTGSIPVSPTSKTPSQQTTFASTPTRSSRSFHHSLHHSDPVVPDPVDIKATHRVQSQEIEFDLGPLPNLHRDRPEPSRLTKSVDCWPGGNTFHGQVPGSSAIAERAADLIRASNHDRSPQGAIG